MTKITLNESLIIPQIILDPQSGREVVIGFDVKTLLDSRQTARNLNGTLITDFLAGIEWGTIPLQPYKVRRWTKHNRLVKRIAELRRDDSVRTRYTYAEENEWKTQLSADDQHWLSSLLEIDLMLYQEQRNECIRRLMVAISEVARLQSEPPKPEVQKPKKKKIKAKFRKKQGKPEYARFSD